MIDIEIKIDEQELKSSIEGFISYQDNEELFSKLSSVVKAKKELLDALEKIEAIEKESKGIINSKAKSLYGSDWKVIAGKGYKITRSSTGAVYTINPEVKVNKKFLKVIESIDTKAVELELEKTEKLPKGIEYNPQRGESLRITIDENSET